MIREIIKYPNPILRRKSGEVGEITDRIKKLAQEMKETMIANQGIGLAAPQVGEMERIIVVQPSLRRTPEEIITREPQVFINPKILKKSREAVTEEEGCLSFPSLFLKIKRVKEVEIEARDENGEKISLRVTGLPARVFQHEIDHLNGILFIDRISFWRRFGIKKKLEIFKT